MISKRLLGFFFVVVLGSVALRAQTPTVIQALPTRTLVAGGASASIHLRDYFSLPTVTGPVVQFDTLKGKFNVELTINDTPKTVVNFAGYINRGAYTNSIVHRSEANFVIQGGGWALNGSGLDPIPTQPPIENEFKFSNTRGTLAMAKTDIGPHTATSQWFINLKDNSTPLDTNNGGYTVFGRVLGTGMTVVDAIAAMPVFDKSGNLGAAFTKMPLLADPLIVQNLALVSSIRIVPLYAEIAYASSAVTFTATSNNPSVAAVEITASTLTVKPLAAGSAVVTARAIDTNGNPAEASFNVTVVGDPLFITDPVSQAVAHEGGTTLTAAATGTATLVWQRNGTNLTNNGALVTAPTVNISNMQPGLAGIYTVVASGGGAATTSKPAILGVTTGSKVIGGGNEIDANILHPNGKTFDQVLLTGTAAAITAEHTIPQTTRLSYIDLDNDIVQVEFSGPGTLSILLEGASGPAAPLNYNQPAVSYVKGHASIVISGATEQTNVSVFTVGRATSYDPTGGFNFLQDITAQNNPANNGNVIFQGHQATIYDGVAGISRISIISSNGKFGGIRAANTNFFDNKGYVGIYAPGVEFLGPVYIGDINASDSNAAPTSSATPVILLGSAADVRITGGNLHQNNGKPVLVSGITKLKFTAGINSHGTAIAAALNQATLRNSAGENVTTQIVVNP